MRARLASVIAALVVLFGPGVAQAICGEAPPLKVEPRRSLVAPTNVHFSLTARAPFHDGKPLVLTTAPRRLQPRERVELRQRTWTSRGTARIELVPTHGLLPDTAYELQTEKGEIVSAFTTGTSADTTAPTWPGLSKGALYKAPTGRVVQVPPECGSPLVVLESQAGATDDQTAPADLRYAIWTAAPKATVDYTAPPSTWARFDPQHQRPGRAFVLSYGTTESDLMDFDIPKTRPLKVGIKVIDLAGNESAPSELTLD